jgi:hypothetical protein
MHVKGKVKKGVIFDTYEVEPGSRPGILLLST